jgi:hypothetical protein
MDIDMLHGHEACTMDMNMYHGHGSGYAAGTRTCNTAMDMQLEHRYAPLTWTFTMNMVIQD